MKTFPLTIEMAVVPMCCKMSYKDQTLHFRKAMRQKTRGFISECSASLDGSKFLYSSFVDRGCRWNGSHQNTDNSGSRPFHTMSAVPVLHKLFNTCSHLKSTPESALQMESLRPVGNVSKSDTNENQLRSLDSYFEKLQREANQPSSSSSKTEFADYNGQFKSKKGLGSLDDYLGKLEDANPENYVSSAFDEDSPDSNPVVASLSNSEDSKRDEKWKLKSYVEIRKKDGESGPKRSKDQQSYDDTCDYYLISIFVSINVAVLIFETASPIRSSESELLSIPLMYGAKINDLILVGEWWRLVTPMFLHSGVFHVTLGSWVLLTFGPQVCRGYGLFTFFLIYLLGGISGNLTSFFHTPDPTVGGTGPIFAIIGAWLIYQVQNKDVIEKDVSESLIHKAIIATAVSFILSHFGPIDDWTHVGAAFAGVAYGFFTCPSLQLDKTPSKTGREEGITLIGRQADPCKSLLVFAIFVLVLSCLLFFLDPPLNTLVANGFV